MKSKKVIISAISLGVLIMLGGCEQSAPVANSPVAPAQKTNPTLVAPQATSNGTAQLDIKPSDTQLQMQQQAMLKPTSQTNAQTAPPQLSEADTAAYQGAIQLNDPTFCDKIKDETYITTCKTALLDIQAGNEAITKMDETFCNKLSTKDAQDACKIQVEVAVKRTENKNDQTNTISSLQNESDQIVKSGNFQQCTSLKDANFVISCELNILENKAVVEKNIKVCESATNQTIIDMCKKNLEGKI